MVGEDYDIIWHTKVDLIRPVLADHLHGLNLSPHWFRISFIDYFMRGCIVLDKWLAVQGYRLSQDERGHNM